MAPPARVSNGPIAVPEKNYDTNNTTKPVTIERRAIDEYRPIKVVVIGAGMSGIMACIRLRQKVPNIDLVIYEKNADIGGTWFENVYPGCACDIPAHTYQASFEPNVEWSSFYAPAAEIHRYWKRVVDKYGCMDYIKLKQQVSAASWDETNAKWNVDIHNLDNGVQYRDQCDVLVQASGCLNNWKWPSIPGLHDFKGKLMHSANWDTHYDYKDQRIAVIGNGSSGIQIVPSTLPQVAHIDHYMRSRTWISPTFARGHLDQQGIDGSNYYFSEDEIKAFQGDKDAYQKFRKETELQLQSVHQSTVLGTPMQIGSIPMFAENMKRRLADKPEILEQIIPDFPVACRRLTPGPGYLEALTNPKVNLIKTDIVEIDEKGITTADGQHRPVDMIVCATGFDTTYAPRFPITGRNGQSMSDRWKGGPETYISVATDGFPNYFICFGPNSALGSGNLILLFEKQVEYLTKCVLKMQRDNIRNMNVKREAVQRFSQYCEEYFKGTVYSGKCRSWYKGGQEQGRISALWPGSSLHAMQVLSNPRWEDFDYEYINENPLGWFGDGWTQNEKNGTINVDYLDEDQIDFPSSLVVHDNDKSCGTGNDYQ